MKIGGFLKSLSFSELWTLLGIGLRNPGLVWPTYKATRNCVAICDRLFGRDHHRNSPANAFRHALWNYLIAAAHFGKFHQLEAAVAWAREITDWHEKFSPNPEVAREMDLHNNRLGRLYFEAHGPVSEAELITNFNREYQRSVKINSMAELRAVPPGQMAHMVDPATEK